MIALTVSAFVALGLTWLGYPACVFLLSRLRRVGVRQPGARPKSVSVILATCDDAKAIRARVANLLATSYDAAPCEVIVGLDSARALASARELSEFDSRVQVVTGDAPGGKAATLNAAVRLARNEVLVFADTAQSFEPTAIGELVATLENPRIGAVSGMLELPSAGVMTPAEAYWRYERQLRRWEARLYSSVGVTGAIYAVRRELWKPLPAGLILDDVYVPMRVVLDGWRVGFTERARATDVRRFAPRQEYRRKVRTLTGVIQLCAWLPAVLVPLRNPIWLQFVMHKLLRLLTPYLVILMGIGALGWLSAQMDWRSHGVAALAATGLFGALIAAVPRARRVVKTQVRWMWALQSSVVAATINGLRGRWDVWQS